MYIKSVTVKNVKSFRDEHQFLLGRGVNFFVGDNNSGKSTVMESLLFLFEGPTSTKWTPEKFYSSDAEGATRVEADIAGDLSNLVAQKKFLRLEEYLFEDNGEQVLRLERSSEEREVEQNGKVKNVTVKAVCFWHPERDQFENVTGIDASVKAIFDFEAVWADAHPSEHIDFANTKTLGRLIDSAFKRFTQKESWKTLTEAHQKVFSPDGEDSFLEETKHIAMGLKELVDEQYGSADYRFDFSLPDAGVFMKQGRLHVDDGAGETPIDGKGTGMQRAVALGVIQLYSKMPEMIDNDSPTPLILMLDEPETWLHPSAQLRLGDALSAIGEHDQVFIVSHSPYLIRKFDHRKHHLIVLSGKGEGRRVKPSTKLGLFGKGEPSWGEINYHAFEICSDDFHNELYGYVQSHLEEGKEKGVAAREWEIDSFLESKGIGKTKVWARAEDKEYPATLPVYVRNAIHHPENKLNAPVTNEELDESTRILVAVIEGIKSS